MEQDHKVTISHLRKIAKKNGWDVSTIKAAPKKHRAGVALRCMRMERPPFDATSPNFSEHALMATVDVKYDPFNDALYSYWTGVNWGVDAIERRLMAPRMAADDNPAWKAYEGPAGGAQGGVGLVKGRTAIPPSLTEIYPLPWSVRPLDHKYYGTEILDANGEVVDGIRVWMGRLDADHPSEWLSPREDWEPGEELSHREDIHSYAIVRAIVAAVNTSAALDGAFGRLHPDQVAEGLTL